VEWVVNGKVRRDLDRELRSAYIAKVSFMLFSLMVLLMKSGFPSLLRPL
jgi:hypothetical protein